MSTKTKNGRTTSKRLGRRGTPSGPRLVDLVNGGTGRLLFHEDRKERQALARLASLQQAQIDRLNEVCKLESAPGERRAEFRATLMRGGKDDQEAIAKPWRRGQCRRYLLLYGDQLNPLGYVSAAIGGHSDHVNPADMVRHLRKTANDLREIAKRLEADIQSRPELWEPLSTLGEFMEAAAAGKAVTL